MTRLLNFKNYYFRSASMSIFGLILALSLGCTKKGKDIEVQLPNGQKLSMPVSETLRVNVTTEPPDMDWNKSTDTASAEVTENIMEGLVGYDFSDPNLGLKPALALKWEPLEKGRKWKFTLRQGVKWTDGVEFTAQHVLDGWKHLLAPATASQYAYFLFYVKNARAFNEGKIKDFSQVGVKAITPYEIEVELDKPISFFPMLMTHHCTFPTRLDVIEKFGNKWTEPENIQTLGPFKMVSWQHDQLLVLQRHDAYYGEKPAIQFVAYYMIIEQTTALNLFNSGKLDALNILPSAEIKKLQERKEFRKLGTMVIQYYGFNVEKAPMNNPLVRRAVNHAIDRKEIVQMLAGGQIPTTSWIPVGMLGYEAERGLSFDIEKARALLKQAGYSDTKKVPKVILGLNTNEDHQRIAENIQAQLKRNLGLDVEIRNEEWKVFLTTLRNDPPHIFRFGWVADYPDPDNMMGTLLSFSENNRTRWKNKNFDSLIEQAASELNVDKRRELYSQAQKLLLEEDAPVLPLYFPVQQQFVAERVQNYPMNALRRFPFSGVRLK